MAAAIGALPAMHAAMPVERVETVALHADIPAVREADRAAAMLAASAVVAVMLAASAVVAAMLAASAAAVVMRAVAAAMAAADIGKLLRLSSRRLACFGRRAFFCELKPKAFLQMV
jgi:hypothetical protein